MFEKLKQLLFRQNRVKTPTVIQMEAVECGAASLGIILGYFGRHIPLETLRYQCGVSRDGSNAADLIRAARKQGLDADGMKLQQDSDVDELFEYEMPLVLYWENNHFLVLEGGNGNKFYINDPAYGPRTVKRDEFEEKFSRIFIEFEPGENFVKSKNKDNVILNIHKRVKGYYLHVTVAFLLSLTLLIPGIVLPGMSQVFIDEILIKKELEYLNGFITVMCLIVAGKIVLSWISESFLVKFGVSLSIKSCYDFIWHLMQVPMNFFSQRSVGDVIARMRSVYTLSSMISGGVSSCLFQIFQAAVYLGIMFIYNVKLTLLTLAFTLFNIIMFYATKRAKRDCGMRCEMASAKIGGLTVNGISNVESLKCSGYEGDFYNKWTSQMAKATNAGVESSILELITGNFLSFCGSISGALTLGVGAYLIIRGELTLGSLTGFTMLASQFNGPVGGLIAFGGGLQQMAVELKRIDDVMEYPVDYKFASEANAHNADESTVSNENFKLSGKIELRNVTFGYSRLKPPLITDFNLTLNPGDRVALVGTSGSGKSTVAKLISGLFLPWEGEVLLDGVPIQNVKPELIANSMSMVDQTPFFFKGSVKGNLTLWSDSISHEQLKKATTDAGIYDEIVARKDAFDAEIQEGGSNFSGGQLQRMEIARSLINNPSILVLDEATSALDPLYEKYIYERIWTYGCSLVIIAHRLSAVRDCDEIIVLDKGKVVERGTHDQLVANNGYYFQLVSNE